MSSAAAPIIVVGSSNTDLVIACDRLPAPGETRLGGHFSTTRGGKGANQAVAAARAGGRVAFVGSRGDDAHGREAEAALRAEDIDTRFFRVAPGINSGVALILIGGKSRENLIAVARSANDRVQAAQVDEAVAALGAPGVVVAQLEVPLAAVRAAARSARRAGCPFLLNPAPARALPDALLRLVDVLVPNEHELREMTGESGIEAGAAALLRRGCRHVLVTLGARGARGFGRDGGFVSKAPRTKAVDTVGAGDCFCGWLAAGLAEGLSLAEAAGRAVKAASLAVTRPGAQAAMPRRSEVVRG